MTSLSVLSRALEKTCREAAELLPCSQREYAVSMCMCMSRLCNMCAVIVLASGTTVTLCFCDHTCINYALIGVHLLGLWLCCCWTPQDLCQHTPDEHPDYSVLKQSFTVMSDFIASTHDPKAFSQVGFEVEYV